MNVQIKSAFLGGSYEPETFPFDARIVRFAPLQHFSSSQCQCAVLVNGRKRKGRTIPSLLVHREHHFQWRLLPPWAKRTPNAWWEHSCRLGDLKPHFSATVSRSMSDQASCSPPVDDLAELHGHVSQQLLQPALPLVHSVAQQGAAGVQQRHRGVAVQLLQAASQRRSPLLEQAAQLRLQVLTLADEVRLAGVLQKSGGRNVTGRTCRRKQTADQTTGLFPSQPVLKRFSFPLDRICQQSHVSQRNQMKRLSHQVWMSCVHPEKQ